MDYNNKRCKWCGKIVIEEEDQFVIKNTRLLKIMKDSKRMLAKCKNCPNFIELPFVVTITSGFRNKR